MNSKFWKYLWTGQFNTKENYFKADRLLNSIVIAKSENEQKEMVGQRALT